MAAVSGDEEFSFGPGTVKRPSAFHGTDNIVAALYDHPGNVPNPESIFQEMGISLKEAFVHEVVGFDARKG